MDPAERLAAYLADELATDERAALEAELARDAGLRAELEAMRCANGALRSLEATPLPDGAEARLYAALAAELEAQLGASDAPASDHRVVSLASRRMHLPRWVPSAAAAALVLVAVVGGVNALRGGGDGDMQAADAPDVAEDAAALADGSPGLVVVAGDRPIGADGADVLLREATATNAGQERLSEAEDEFAPFAATEDADVPAEEGLTETRARDFLRYAERRGSLTSTEFDQVARCLDVLLDEDGLLLPVYAELVRFDGVPAVVYVLATANNPALQVRARAGCGLLHTTGG